MSKQVYAQASLFRRNKNDDINVSYSSSPNSELHQFVEAHATPYDPNDDFYDISDFSSELKGNRHSAAYNFLSYSSKKPYEPIEKYLKHFTQSGDLILDTFCGSGGVGFVASKINRKAILIDLSPLATMISAAYSMPVDVSLVEKAFKQIKARSAANREKLYGTRCHLCDGKAEIEFLVHSQTYRCTKCFTVVPLASCNKEGKKKLCPHCGEPISTRQERLGVITWASQVKCLEGCREVPLRYHDDVSERAREYFKQDISNALQGTGDYEVLQEKSMLDYQGTERRWGLLWRPYHEDIQTVADFFTKRNLQALLDIRAIIQDLDVPETVKMILMVSLASIVPSASRQQRYYPGSTFPNMVMPGVLYIPPVNEEINVYKRFLSKRRSAIRGAESIRENIQKNIVCISTQSATNISEIPDNSIDYVFTDPPYSGRIQYGELNFLSEAILELDTSWLNAEIIENEFRGWDLQTWASRLEAAMKELYRVLKPGRWISVCYHDSDPASWTKLQDMMLAAGFIPGGAALSSMETGWQSLKMHTSTNITKRDLVINFRKPKLSEIPGRLVLDDVENSSTFQEKAKLILAESLEAHPGSPADRLYDELVSRMVRQRTLERHNFDELLRSVAEEVDGRWYLLETAGQVDAAEGDKEETAAARLEAFMKTYLVENPGETGIHFSDLFEQNLYVQDKPRRNLKEWLPEYFFRTESATWRPPANDEEREQKAALRSSGTLRRIKRFGNALLEGVPPADRDQPENLATAADWVRQCRRAGLYELGRALFEKGGFNFSELDDEAFLEVEEDYQLCVRRS